MTEMHQEVKQFLIEEVKTVLTGLREDTPALWGHMTPQHMVEHLIVTFKMSIGRIKIPVVSADEDLPRIKAYLMKDSPMRRSVPSPLGRNELQPLRSLSLDEAKDKFLNEVDHFLKFQEGQPHFVANHPYGGPATATEWLYIHRKHIKHHFIQFGLIPDYESGS